VRIDIPSEDGIARCGKMVIRARSCQMAFGGCRIGARLASWAEPSDGSRWTERIAVDVVLAGQTALGEGELHLGSSVVAGSASRWCLVSRVLAAVVGEQMSVLVAVEHMVVVTVAMRAAVMVAQVQLGS
jgi:hypothetical protein